MSVVLPILAVLGVAAIVLGARAARRYVYGGKP